MFRSLQDFLQKVVVKLGDPREVEVSEMWTGLGQGNDTNLLELSVCICEGKVDQVGQPYVLEALLELEVTAVHLELDEGMLVVPEYVLEVNIRQEMPAEDFGHVGEAGELLDHLDVWPVWLCYQDGELIEVLLENDVDLAG